MREKLNEYLTKGYVIEIVPIPEDKGGGFMARLPEIGRLAIIGDGDTIQEAIEDLEALKRERFAEYLKEGVKIPEPKNTEEQFSGKFVLRVPKSLHRDLVISARDNGVSLNNYASYLLTTNLERDILSRKVKKCMAELKTEVSKWRKHVSNLSYEISGGQLLQTNNLCSIKSGDDYSQAA